MYIDITLSDDAVRNKFIETGKMVRYDDRHELYVFDPESLTNDERELIFQHCKFNGDDTFIFDCSYMDSYNYDIHDIITLIRDYDKTCIL